MRGFRAERDGQLSAEFEQVEAVLLSRLAGQLAGILRAEGTDVATPDPALARLLPDAYTDDPDAAAEFRRFTAADLTERKVRNAVTVIAGIDAAVAAEASTEVRLDAPATQAWLRTLTDIRLVLATRLGIELDGDSVRADDESVLLGDVYDWLGWMQESLVNALDS